jgi:hypothetical protein
MPGTRENTVFDRLPRVDPIEFQPPAWANGPEFDFTRKNGESSKSGRHGPTIDSIGAQDRSSRHTENTRTDHDEEEFSDEDGEEVWEDARSGLEETVEVTDEGLAFTLPEIKVCRDQQ